jgi:2-amino-4-hydroxy-6-hydroxymethyldihydropteridine diphosphokinase
MTATYIGLGSNLGDRFANLFDALGLLINGSMLKTVSSVYRTEPQGYEQQPDFLNCVVEAVTDMEPIDLLKDLKNIERLMGREATFRNGPRLIDLDILLYGDRVIDTSELIVPHPRLQERAFMLVPLCEIAPEIVHPVLHKTIRELLWDLKDVGVVEKWGKITLGL